MTDTFHHGARVTELSEGPRPLREIATGVIGLVATAEDADAVTFPLNTPVQITDVAGKIGKAGEEGTLANSLQGIMDQTSPTVVVVRVAEGADAAATTANVIGTDVGGSKTGLQALLAAKAQLGIQPRIIGAPGLETQAVATALETIAPKLRGMAYAGCGAVDDIAEAVTYRANFSGRELMLLYPDWKAFNVATGLSEVSYAAARALGLRARIDEEQGWHKSLSNVAVRGVTGISADIHWDLQDADTDAGQLNAADITALINVNGYRYWGNRTCSDDPLFAFETATRTAQVLSETIANGLLWAIDRPLHPSLARDIIETINNEFRQLKALGYILGGEAWIDPTVNTQDVLAAGKLYIDYDYTPCPPLEQLNLRQRITARHLADFATQVSRA